VLCRTIAAKNGRGAGKKSVTSEASGTLEVGQAVEVKKTSVFRVRVPFPRIFLSCGLFSRNTRGASRKNSKNLKKSTHPATYVLPPPPPRARSVQRPVS
jgi:hypothetical protein